jgi:hypothetical protein
MLHRLWPPMFSRSSPRQRRRHARGRPSAVNLTFSHVSHFRVTLASSPNVTSYLLPVWPFVGRSLLRARKYKSRSSRTSSDPCNSLRFSCRASTRKFRCIDPAVSPSRFDVKPFRSFLDHRRSGRLGETCSNHHISRRPLRAVSVGIRRRTVNATIHIFTRLRVHEKIRSQVEVTSVRPGLSYHYVAGARSTD